MLSVHFCCVYMWDGDSADCNARPRVSSPRDYFNMVGASVRLVVV
jgi:hypothetical protein